MPLNKCEADVVTEARARKYPTDSTDLNIPSWRKVVQETSRTHGGDYHEGLAANSCADALAAYRASLTNSSE